MFVIVIEILKIWTIFYELGIILDGVHLVLRHLKLQGTNRVNVELFWDVFINIFLEIHIL